ncbi:hypothetical protein EG68_03524 [Paragonimus skrjabini miyazakii]|uniref:BHLH domain-containing protein n=1 Tax=Paragonimus skrjabini miyazakii TaxID=59628 RepID=A0A8S9Z6E1_9TREM|nr:hypothetical protein EG68_03524 [Paragonimus skrjabini miyazakii]
MHTSQSPLSIPPGLFSASPYDPLQPFLVAAAAAAEAHHQPNHLDAYSVYYDAVTREASQRLGLYPTTSSLAAAIIGTSGNSSGSSALSQVSSHEQEADFIRSSLTFPCMSAMRNLTPCFPPLTDSFVNRTDPVVRAEQTVHRRAARVTKRVKAQPTLKTGSTRLTQSWPCNCSCVQDEETLSTSDNSSRHNADCNSSMNSSNAHHDPLSVSSETHNGESFPPFECAKSFIRRRNARERERVRCVNAGYESLRRRLPLTSLPDRRLAKVEILRGAITYIRALRDLLEK